jgi:hypothetical protein
MGVEIVSLAMSLIERLRRAAQGACSAFDADDLAEVGHDLDQVGLGGHDRLQVLVGTGDLVQHPGVLTALDPLVCDSRSLALPATT